jgi:predicted dehydrogenase
VLRKALEDAGGFGALTGVFVDWSEQPKSFLNRGFSRDAVERLIFANSLHALDLITHLAGAVPYPLVQVQDLGEPLRWNMALTGLSERGILVNFTSTWDSPARWRMSLTSPGRRYTLAPLETCSVLEQGSWQERIIDPDPVDSEFKPGFHRQALAFLALVRGRTSPEGPSLESLRPGMRLADALTEALLSASETETEPGDS